MALEKFLQEGLSKFSRDRAKTDRSSTSRLSSHIHYGELSIRFIYYVVSPPPPGLRLGFRVQGLCCRYHT